MAIHRQRIFAIFGYYSNQSLAYMQAYLQETYFIDYSHPRIQSLVAPFRPLSKQEQIAELFRKIRDDWRYNPFDIYVEKAYYRASFVAGQTEGHCIDKSTLFVAGLRALGIPARLRLAKVINHLAVERLTEKLGSHHIAPHGIAEVLINGQWFKASNAFNKSLCDRFKVDVLEFDGSRDAILQAFDQERKQFMEYVEDYGFFADVPLDFIIETFRRHYPTLHIPEGHQGKIVF
jgi:transglutaminase-like putative cysteine protease